MFSIDRLCSLKVSFNHLVNDLLGDDMEIPLSAWPAGLLHAEFAPCPPAACINVTVTN